MTRAERDSHVKINRWRVAVEDAQGELLLRGAAGMRGVAGTSAGRPRARRRIAPPGARRGALVGAGAWTTRSPPHTRTAWRRGCPTSPSVAVARRGNVSQAGAYGEEIVPPYPPVFCFCDDDYESSSTHCRRVLMRGCITHRADGTYAAVIELSRGPDGRRRHKWFGGYRTRKEAQVRLTALLGELQGGTFVAPSKMTVAEYLRRWLTESAAPRLSGRSLERTRCIVERHLVPELGGCRLCDLRPLHIQSYLSAARKSGRKNGRGGLAGATLLKHFEVLHSALGQAVRWELIARNPASAVDRPRIETRPGQAIRALSGEEVAALLAAATGDRLYTPILVAVTTGLRRGELLALRWSDLDLERATLSVNRALEETGSGVTFKSPKTARSRRTIPLAQTTVRALRDHHRAQAALKLKTGPAYADQDLVFATLLGTPWSPSDFSRSFRTFKARHGYDFRFHDLRHTHASLLLALGVHVKVVQERLGHASVTMTMDTYSHLLPGVQEAAVERFDEALSLALEPGH